jgi:hypothetical protein
MHSNQKVQITIAPYAATVEASETKVFAVSNSMMEARCRITPSASAVATKLLAEDSA